MKKILCGILCASAGAALAVESQVTTIDVIEVRSDLTNVVIAIPGQDLAGGPLAISNLVKTAKNLTNGDRLFAFDSGTSKYQAWVLTDGKWIEVTEVGQDNDGKVEVVAGTPAVDKTMLVGEGIWLHRQNPSASKPFYVYGAHALASTSVDAGSTVLVGNPKTVAATPLIPTPSVGDQVIIPTAGLPITYTYRDSAWGYMQDGVLHTGLPSIAAGTGFWYVSKGASDVTINW